MKLAELTPKEYLEIQGGEANGDEVTITIGKIRIVVIKGK